MIAFNWILRSIFSVLFFSTSTIAVHAEDFIYQNSNGSLTITGYTGPGGAVTIPGTINGLPVTGIGYVAFYEATGVTSVTIPNGVTSIGDNAFHGCTGLTNLAIPNSVTSFGDHVFYGCTGLTGVAFPDSVTSIGENVFYGCIRLTSVALPNNLTRIANGTFYGCAALNNVTIPASVTSIGEVAFGACSSLTSVIIPDGITSISYATFYGCTSLASVTIPGGVTSIGDRAFYSCHSLTGLVIPSGVTRIGEAMFFDCASLTSVTIPNGVTSIGEAAFSGCDSLNGIMLPNSVAAIGQQAFYGCASLTSLTLPTGVASVPYATFRDCTSLTRVTIPGSVTYLDSFAFFGCSNLNSVYFLGNAPALGSSVFGEIYILTIYYRAGTTGWGTSFDGHPTAQMVVVPPTISAEPANVTVTAGSTATFSVTATGSAPSYQWQKDGVNVPGATGATLALSGVQTANAGSYKVLVSNSSGSVSSSQVTLTVVVQPAITAEPTNVTVTQGGNAAFSVTATGGALAYQWKKGEVNISGATGATLVLSNVQTANAGDYKVVASNLAGSVTSNAATLTVNLPPAITAQPVNVTRNQGASATFGVTATGTGVLSYQWKKGGVEISGATGASLEMNNLQTAQAGSYTVVITNAYGSVTSNPATLTVNALPTISDIADRSTNEDVNTGAVPFTVGDLDTSPFSLTLSGSSSNTALVPNANIVFAGSGTNRTVRVTPAANLNGSVTITVNVSDGAATATDTFVLTVNPVNDPPTVGVIANQFTSEDLGTGAIAFTVGDLETSAESLTPGGSSSNLTLVPNANIVFGGSGANRTLAITPAANQSGSATITVTVSDGTLIATRTFVLTVNAVNDAPTITDIADRGTNEDVSTGALAFTVADPETPATSLVLGRSSSNTALVPTANIVFGGSGTNRTVTVTPVANQNGNATITVTVSDGLLAATDTFVLTVTAVNDAPTIGTIANRSTDEDVSMASIAFIVGDIETAAASLTLAGSSSNTDLVPNANIVFGGGGANRTLIVTPAANQNETATITVTVSDGLLTTTSSFVLTVNPVNDAPTIGDIADRVTDEDVGTEAIVFTLSDLETAAASLTLTGSSSNPMLVSNANIVFGGSGASRTVTVTPAANKNGAATITVTVNDGGLTATDTFELIVNPVIDVATVTLGNLAATYDGTPKPVTVTTVPAGLAVTVTYDGQSLPPSQLGSHAIEATVNDAVYTGSASGNLEIAKGIQQITFSSIPNQNLDQTSVTVHATASSGLPPVFSVVSGPATVTGQTLSLAGLGVVVVRADQPGDPNWNSAPPIQNTFHVFAGHFDQDFVWAKGFGGVSSDTASGIATDSTGNAFVAVDFTGTVPFGNFTLTAAGSSSDLALLKVAADGKVLSASRFGGSSVDLAKAVAVDVNDNVILAGEFFTSTTIGAVTHTAAGSKDISLIKTSPSGALLWSTRFGGTVADSVYGLTVDAGGNILLTGDFSGSISFGATTLISNGGRDGFVAKLDPSGSPLWAMKIGGTGNDTAYAVAVSPGGQIFVGGSFSATAAFGSFNRSSAGGTDGFAMAVSPVGTVQWASRFGGSSNDSARALEVDVTGAACVAGNFAGTDAAFGTEILASEGADDAFVIRLAATDGSFLNVRQCGGEGADAALGLAADAFGSLYLSGSYSGTAYFGGDTLITPQGTDCFVAKLSLDGGFVWAMDGSGSFDEKATSIAVNAAGHVFVAGLFSQSAQFGTHAVTGGGLVDLFIAKINGPTPSFVSTLESISADAGDPFSISAPAVGVDPITYQWFKDAVVLVGEATSTLQVAAASPGDQGTYHVVASNLYGSSSLAATVTVRVPDRILTLAAPLVRQENRLLEVPLYLDSNGEVTGLTVELPYDRDLLRNPSFELGHELKHGNSSVVVDTLAGTVRVVGSAFPSSIPSGHQLIGTFRFTIRSVPDGAVVNFVPTLPSISDLSGNPLAGYTKLIHGMTSIARRVIPGDANNNGRLDVSDAAELIRLYANPSQIRIWDHSLNDLNGDNILTEGDATRVLRVVADLDEIPAFPAIVHSVASGDFAKGDLPMMNYSSLASGAPISIDQPPLNLSAATSRLVLTRLTGADTNKILAQVYLDDVPAGQAGLSFQVNYPASILRIASASSLIIPAGALPSGVTPTWNVAPGNSYANQAGSVSIAAAWNSSWNFTNGQAVANIVFEIQSTNVGQVSFPLTLEDANVGPYDVDGPSSPLGVTGHVATFTRTYADWALATLGDANADPSADSDHDGFSNGLEFTASTNPGDAQSRLQTTSASLTPTGFTLRWFAAYGVSYRVCWSSDFVSWNDLPNSSIVGTGAETELTDPSPPAGGRFYRVEIVGGP